LVKTKISDSNTVDEFAKVGSVNTKIRGNVLFVELCVNDFSISIHFL